MMIQRTYAARMERIQNMLGGLTANLRQLPEAEATPEFLNSLAQLHRRVRKTQAKRRTIKTSALEATAAKNKDLQAAEQLCTTARKWVRKSLPKEEWEKFGFKQGDYAKTRRLGETDHER